MANVNDPSQITNTYHMYTLNSELQLYCVCIIIYNLMFQVMYKVENPRSLLKLHTPLTSKVKVTWLNQNAALSEEELKAIFPDALFNYVVHAYYRKIISYSYNQPQRPY